MHVETDIRVVVHGLTPLLRRNGCAVSMTAGIKTKRVHRARSTTAVNPLSCDERLCVFVSVREQSPGLYRVRQGPRTRNHNSVKS